MARPAVDKSTSKGRTKPPLPDEPSGRRGPEPRMLILAGLLLLLLLMPLAGSMVGFSSYVLQVLMVMFMWIAITSSWNIIGGFAGYLSLGHPVFFAVGGYMAGLLLVYFGLSPFLTAAFTGVLAALVGLGLGLITLRTRGPAFIIATIALLLMARLWFDNWDLVGGANGLSLPLPSLPLAWANASFYYAMLCTAIGAVYLAYRIKRSKFGLGLRAIAADEMKADVAGINTRRYKILAFALSAIFVAVAGAIWGYSLSYLRPTAFLSIAVAADMMLMPIIGGRGTIAGPVVGSVLIVAVNEFAVAQFGSTTLNLAVTGLLLLIVLLFFPSGIVGSLRERGRLPRFLDWD